MENPTITQLQNRKSIRQFTGEAIKDADLELIFKTAQRAPTSINAQQISLVYTRDKAKLARIAELCGGQAHVAKADVFVGIVIDFNRTSAVAESLGKNQVIEQSAEGIIIGAVDAGIMLNHLQSAAEALGYGTTCLGSVRNSMEEFITLFNLPKKTLLLVGTTIGVPTEKAKNAPLKPRVALDSFVMEDTYDKASRRDDLESTAYALIYMVKGELPWQHITNKETRRKRMGQMKMQFTPEQLCAGLPHCFAEFLRYSMSLEFAAEPDYAYLRRLFEDTLNMIPGSWAAPYEWTVHASAASRPHFIHTREEFNINNNNNNNNTNWTETVPAQLESPGNSSLGHSSPPATPLSSAIPPNPWQQGGFSKIQLSITSAHCHSQEFKCVGVPSPRPAMEPIVIDDDMDVDYPMQYPSAGILTVA